jgi:hypothetical protein
MAMMCGMGRRGQGRMVTERAAAAESYAAARSTVPAGLMWLADRRASTDQVV